MSSLVVNTNQSAINAFNNLNSTDAAMTKAISELSSGLQIQTAADNPAGYVVAEGLESAPRALMRLFTGDNQGKQLVRIAP